MTSRRDNNRASFYHSRARCLAGQAMAEHREERRLHLFDLAEAFERAARGLSPPQIAEGQSTSRPTHDYATGHGWPTMGQQC